MFGYKPRKVDAIEIITEADGKETIFKLKKCCHCGVNWRKIPGSGAQRGFCYKCMDDFCGPNCARCYPHEQQLIDEGKLLNSLIGGSYV